MAGSLLVSTRKGLFTLRRGPSGWAVTGTSFLGVPVTLTLTDRRTGTVYAAVEHGHFGPKLHASTDGVTWSELVSPAFSAVDGEAGPSVSTIWALEAGPASRPGELWCGTIPGGLFRSDDGGASWVLNEALWDHPARDRWFGGGADAPGIHSILLDPRDDDCLRVAVSCGGVWRSDDRGASWSLTTGGMFAAYMPPDQQGDGEIQDPHQVVQCPSAPDVLWCQHHNGIFRSIDGGLSWASLEPEPSVFGFAVAVHPHDPEVAWFVPADSDACRVPVDGKVVVTRTRDGGASFQVLTEGLPQDHAYDLVFRHALAVDHTGDCLAFGSTTGSVWISEDGGDSWVAVSTHLPPVYAVRFGT